jgi:hypothetical protein
MLRKTLLLSLLAAGCSGGGGGDDSQPNFATFVKNQIQATADDTEPVEITGKDFQFPKKESAFDDILPQP